MSDDAKTTVAPTVAPTFDNQCRETTRLATLGPLAKLNEIAETLAPEVLETLLNVARGLQAQAKIDAMPDEAR
ncbi:hypothetical protein [Rubripirellula obstinata]|uniref:hypothetical protein n=1 Tax=Rubripirellula obstinata TaxID=406547 RepID=UPI000836C95F|nr:hypothetical protein [Rubripirellula obstinata]